jgi:hypothetical protein
MNPESCQNFPPLSGFRFLSFPQVDLIVNYSAFTEGLLPLTEIPDPKILILSEASS